MTSTDTDTDTQMTYSSGSPDPQAAATDLPDINDLSLWREIPVEVDDNMTAEQFYTPNLPDDGEHRVRWTLGTSGVKPERLKNKSTGKRDGVPSFVVEIAGTILDDVGQETLQQVFDRLRPIRMANGSTFLHAFLAAAGVPATGITNLADLLDHTKMALAQRPETLTTTEWEAQVEDESKPKGTRERYRTVCVGQKRFPPVLDASGNPTGKYNPEIRDPQTGATVRARVNVKKHLLVR